MSDKVIYTPPEPPFMVQRNVGFEWMNVRGFYEQNDAEAHADVLTCADPGEKYRVVERGDDGE